MGLITFLRILAAFGPLAVAWLLFARMPGIMTPREVWVLVSILAASVVLAVAMYLWLPHEAPAAGWAVIYLAAIAMWVGFNFRRVQLHVQAARMFPSKSEPTSFAADELLGWLEDITYAYPSGIISILRMPASMWVRIKADRTLIATIELDESAEEFFVAVSGLYVQDWEWSPTPQLKGVCMYWSQFDSEWRTAPLPIPQG